MQGQGQEHILNETYFSASGPPRPPFTYIATFLVAVVDSYVLAGGGGPVVALLGRHKPTARGGDISRHQILPDDVDAHVLVGGGGPVVILLAHHKPTARGGDHWSYRVLPVGVVTVESKPRISCWGSRWGSGSPP